MLSVGGEGYKNIVHPPLDRVSNGSEVYGDHGRSYTRRRKARYRITNNHIIKLDAQKQTRNEKHAAYLHCTGKYKAKKTHFNREHKVSHGLWQEVLTELRFYIPPDTK